MAVVVLLINPEACKLLTNQHIFEDENRQHQEDKGLKTIDP